MLGLGLGIQKAKALLNAISKYISRVLKDGGTFEGKQNLNDEFKRVKTAAGKPSLSMIASGYKGLEDIDNTQGFLGTVYSVLPEAKRYQLFDINGVAAQGGTPATYLQVDVENNQFTVLANSDFSYVFITANDNKLFAGKQYTVNVTYTSNGNTSAIRLYGQNNLNAGNLVEGENTQTIIMDSDQNGNDVRLRFYVAGNNADITFSNISINYESDGDFDFSRGSDATRVDENGFVKSVQLLDNTELVTNGTFDTTTTGVELVDNGDFEEISTNEELTYTNFSLVGNELVPNGDFYSNSFSYGTAGQNLSGTHKGLYPLVDDRTSIMPNYSSSFQTHPGPAPGTGTYTTELLNDTNFSNAFVANPTTGDWVNLNNSCTITNGVLRLVNNPQSNLQTNIGQTNFNGFYQDGVFSASNVAPIEVTLDIAGYQLSHQYTLITLSFGDSYGYSLTAPQYASANYPPDRILPPSTGGVMKFYVFSQRQGSGIYDGFGQPPYRFKIQIQHISTSQSNLTDYIDINSVSIKQSSDIILPDNAFNLTQRRSYHSLSSIYFNIDDTDGMSSSDYFVLPNLNYDRNKDQVFTLYYSYGATSAADFGGGDFNLKIRGDNNAWSRTITVQRQKDTYSYIKKRREVQIHVNSSDLLNTTSTDVYVEFDGTYSVDYFGADKFLIYDFLIAEQNVDFTSTFGSVVGDGEVQTTVINSGSGKLVSPYGETAKDSNYYGFPQLFDPNTIYNIRLRISNYTSGDIKFGFEDPLNTTDIEGPALSANGTYNLLIATGAGVYSNENNTTNQFYGLPDNVPYFLNSNNFVGTVEILADYTTELVLGNSWSMSGLLTVLHIENEGLIIKNTSGGDVNFYSPDFNVEAFENYQIQTEVTDMVSGSMSVTLDTGSAALTNITSDGEYVTLREPTSTGTTDAFFTFSNGFEGTVKYLSINQTNLDGVDATYHIDSSPGVYIDDNALQLDYRAGQSTYFMYGLSNSGASGDAYIDNRVYKAEIQGTGNINFRSSASGPNSTNVPLTLPASHYFTWTGGDTNDRFQIGQTGTSGATVDSVSLKIVDPNNEWNFGAASGTIFDGEVILDPGISQNRISQSGVMLSGNNYKLSVEITEIASGDTLEYLNDGAWHLVGDSVGVHEVSIINTAETALFLRNNNGAQRIKFDNVSLEEITSLSDWTFSNNWGHSYDNGTAVGNGTSGYLYQGISVTPGKKYRISFEVKNYVSGRVWPVINGSVNTDGTEVTANGIYTEDLIADLGANGNVSINAISFNGEIDNISVLELSQDTDIPRLDYSYGSPALLLEPQRTNFVKNSNVFTQWTFNQHQVDVIQSEGSSAPDGSALSNKLIVDTNSSQSEYYLRETFSYLLNTNYTFSVFAKKEELNFLRLRMFATGGTNEEAYFDLQNGTVGFTGSNVIVAKMDQYSNGWYRCIMTIPVGGTVSNSLIDIAPAVSDGVRGGVNELNNGIYIYGAQIEEGSYATSYIPTNSSTVTRLKDICKTSADKYIINNTEGVLYAEFLKTHENTDTFYLISLNNLTAASDQNSVAIGFNAATNFYLRVKAGGVNALIQDSGTYASDNEYHKVALKYKSGECAAWVNGVEVISTTDTFTFSKPLNNISFDYNGNNILPYYGHVRALHYFDEALTDDQLQALTT